MFCFILSKKKTFHIYNYIIYTSVRLSNVYPKPANTSVRPSICLSFRTSICFCWIRYSMNYIRVFSFFAFFLLLFLLLHILLCIEIFIIHCLSGFSFSFHSVCFEFFSCFLFLLWGAISSSSSSPLSKARAPLGQLKGQ